MSLRPAGQPRWWHTLTWRTQLEALLATFPASAAIKRGTLIITVTAPNGVKVLSAAKMRERFWNVRAVPGLITETIK